MGYRRACMHACTYLGGRWGTWGYRARALARERRPELRPFLNYFVEPAPAGCAAIRSMAALNRFNLSEIRLECAKASVEGFLSWSHVVLQRAKFIDVVDIDIQGVEAKLLTPELMSLFNSRVLRVIIGTHTGWPVFERITTHPTVKRLFANWIVLCDRPVSTYTGCLDRFLRGCKETPQARLHWT